MQPTTNLSSLQLPVLFWIHGGGMEYGDGSMGDAIYQTIVGSGIVMVSINYRLGPFGITF